MNKFNTPSGQHSVPPQFIADSSILATIKRDLQRRGVAATTAQIAGELQALIARESNPIMKDIYRQALAWVVNQEEATHSE
ncbi:hypothetical protein [Shimwellia blattae]|uniref:Uncharacterized protein n=1 Tax=Shimwellia blattae (strain ATCC 29907 / DSM 4481 / JCM 1650 / NBRC 105725 / CDC 9005-74) TaxID=630626 RepID=I2BBW6_SHIBC|nr:hypothetical protein [Shimwellia blattae]AFJ48020.1 hypothetical protein EBL_c29500 [Shimwellia blattae DSM 4481 = NBRC 105725]GAB81991.1 hypothetical protein EB105725_18_01190 [Shimwellia blattae DSM 4481 = NBRC 105725]VDY65519.1 Uncharacterised protein [Shimwellia blattae]VEC24832.1 Uncharacterised protein [Shimwellia blattae]